ncbi:mucin-2 [Streptomyces sp. NPDC006355]|uniref:PP2C family protein-serine/threonine phosphatase n=1 Tax=Streptomyces sp. NPDC006355 TaxID=3156758 RepID=UPI0033A53F2D
MRHHATAQHIGGRSHQCDVTAVVAAPGGIRAYALLDGVGSTPEVARWTRGAAHRVAASAVRRQDAEAGLRAAYSHYANQPDRWNPWLDLPHAAAVVAVTAPGKPLTVAWCGDPRAYLWSASGFVQLTADHNDRRVHPRYGSRHALTSCLGATATDEEVESRNGHLAVESTTRHLGRWGRLLLASDGAYEPLEDASSLPLVDYLPGELEEVALSIVEAAVEIGGEYADNATALIADLHY